MAYTVVGDQRVVGSAQLWRKIAEFTMPRDFSLKCKTFEIPYPSVPTKSSEKKPFLPGRFRSHSGAFYTECIVCLGTSSHKQITCDAACGAAVPTSSASITSTLHWLKMAGPQVIARLLMVHVHVYISQMRRGCRLSGRPCAVINV